MESLRRARKGDIPNVESCCRCGQAHRRWDRIAGQAYCPNCQEQLIQGEGKETARCLRDDLLPEFLDPGE